MGRPKTQGLVCPMCKKDFSKLPTGTTSYKRHVARKNPCVPPEGRSYERKAPEFFKGVVLNDYDEISLAHVIGPNSDGRKESWIRAMLHQAFSLPENRCVVVRNKEDYPDTIYVKRQGETKVMNIHDLTILTLLLMHERLFPFLELTRWDRYKEFGEWIESVSGVDLKDPNWSGAIEPLSYYYIAVRDFLKNYLLTMKDKRHQTWMLASATFKG